MARPPRFPTHLPAPDHFAFGGKLHGHKVRLAGVGPPEAPARVPREDESAVARHGDALKGVVFARPILMWARR